MRRGAVRAALFLSLLCTCLVPGVARAQSSGDSGSEVEISNGGWGVTGAALTWLVAANGAFALAGAALEPEDRSICELSPERCRPSVGDYVVAGGILLGLGGAVALGGVVTHYSARGLGLSPKLGWVASGATLGLVPGLFTALLVPRFEARWVTWTLHGLSLVGMIVGGAWGMGAIASRRGHAWPEAGLSVAGMTAGVSSALLACDNPRCKALPALGLTGAVLGVAAAGLIWGYAPPESTSGATQSLYESSRVATYRVPMLQLGGRF
jgi:hypothetical protein